MIKEALDYLVGLGLDRNTPKLLKVPGGKVLVTGAGDMSGEYQENPLRADDAVDSLSELVKWLATYGGEDREPVVFVGCGGVVAIVDRELPHHVERVRVGLAYSAAYVALQKLCCGMKQVDLVRALRGPLDECFDSALLPIFRRLDFRRAAEASGDVKHTGSKLGRSVELSAQSADGEIPEYIVFALPMFTLAECDRVRIRCAVEVDANAELIRVQPVGDSVEQGIVDTLAGLREWLESRLEGVAVVFQGTADSKAS